ncbi:DUF2127 domain-containing protein [Candidatus Woesearchaeota archaeon]|nr:DUF2127 domain-containing protein [Candidatus Woesearchaeota archaeon]
MAEKEISKPIAIKIIFFYYLLAGLYSILIALALVSGIGGNFVSDNGLFFKYKPSDFIFAGIEYLLVGVLSFAISFGLWNRKEWARIVGVITAALGIYVGIISALSYMEWTFILTIFDAFVFAYLGFSKQNRVYFL